MSRQKWAALVVVWLIAFIWGYIFWGLALWFDAIFASNHALVLQGCAIMLYVGAVVITFKMWNDRG